MLHCQLFAYDLQEGGGPWYEYGCIKCGREVHRGNQDFLEYLIREGEQAFCEECDPLPDCIPEALRADTITVNGLMFDIKNSLMLGVPLVLFTKNSQT